MEIKVEFAVDARMLFSSGIGVVIRNVLLRWQLGPGMVIVCDSKSADWCLRELTGWEVRIAKSKIYSISEQIEMPRLLSTVSVVWVPHYNLPLFSRAKAVVTVHDVLHLARPDLFPGLLKQLYARFMMKYAVRNSERLICVSEFSALEISRLISHLKEDLEVVYNGVDSDWFTVSPSRGVEIPYFVYVGNIKPHKNLVKLLQAFEIVVKKMDVRLLIVGAREGFITGDDRVKKFAERFGDQVNFTGQVSDSRLKDVVGNALAMVFPSTYEGFGLPPLEAMAAGVPVVASNAASIPEVCGEAAIYFDPQNVDEMASKMLSVASMSSTEREQYIAAGRSRAAEFNWDNSARRICQILQEVGMSN